MVWTPFKIFGTLDAGNLIILAMVKLRPYHLPQGERWTDDKWIHALSVVGSTTRKELLDRALSNNDLLYRLFWEGGVRTYDAQAIEARCRCSQVKIKDMLDGFSVLDRQEMLFEDKITVTCEFCGVGYSFSEDDF
jgi:molecular chaperone Hsp33